MFLLLFHYYFFMYKWKNKKKIYTSQNGFSVYRKIVLIRFQDYIINVNNVKKENILNVNHNYCVKVMVLLCYHIKFVINVIKILKINNSNQDLKLLISQIQLSLQILRHEIYFNLQLFFIIIIIVLIYIFLFTCVF